NRRRSPAVLFLGVTALSFVRAEIRGGEPLTRRIVCALLALWPALAGAEGNSLPLSYVETENLRLVYFDPLGYLVPHAVRTYTNALAWERRTFDWSPRERTTIVLNDF